MSAGKTGSSKSLKINKKFKKLILQLSNKKNDL